MKFSEIRPEEWVEWKPYLDTCIIPYTGLTGQESPIEAVSALENLRDFLDIVETPFKGRVVTYPAFHYTAEEHLNSLNDVCRQLKSSGFKFVIIMSTGQEINPTEVSASDLIFTCPKCEISVRSSKEESAEKINQLSQKIHREVYRLWGLQ
ncbi:DUF2487 family protein [Paenibacillus shunpengii]|uniref:DUF2487 family protein n=1 Tax=Paenibacillus shunpengii TaxID=2054424 RepID=A0ABW5SQR9_9BACL|nr:DUF2487 family protein [Paenibacillus sp. PDC88]SDW59382.1 Protein of unknown function [Paenibacillus sp. PDC88]